MNWFNPNVQPFINILKEARKIRKIKNISTVNLANKIGYDVSTIADWERGRHSPKLSSFIDYCNGIGLDLKLVEKDKI